MCDALRDVKSRETVLLQPLRDNIFLDREMAQRDDVNVKAAVTKCRVIKPNV